MRFHWPSFLLGCAVGAAGTLLASRLRPVIVELATAAYELADSVGVRAARWREDVEDALAEARARARSPRPRRRARARA